MGYVVGMFSTVTPYIDVALGNIDVDLRLGSGVCFRGSLFDGRELYNGVSSF